MTRVLVTGGAGFIGSHVADALLAHGVEVRILDWLHPAAHAVRPEYLDPAAEFVHGDVRDGATVAASLEGVDHVCHQAAMVGLGTDIGDIADYVAHNDFGTAVLLRELARMRFGGRRARARASRSAARGGPARRALRAALPGLWRGACTAEHPRGRAA
jgi:dTDP-L-rhamnose 4-epimerase